jgi:hypothetical protein
MAGRCSRTYLPRFTEGEPTMIVRNPLRTWAILVLLLAIVSLAWTPPEPPVASREAAPESDAAPYVGPEIVISELSGQEYSPAGAYSSKHNEYLVVWEVDWGGGYHDIHARRISGDGRLLSEFSLANESGHSQANPAVAYDPINDRYLVVWAYDYWGNSSDWDVYGSFIPWNGPQGEVNDFSICDWDSNQAHPAVVYAGTQKEFLIVWKSEASGVAGYISGRRITAATGDFPAGDGFTISSGNQIRDFPDVAYNLHRNEYLVTWDLEKTAMDIDIYGKRLRGDGETLTGGSPPVKDEFVIAYWPDFEAMPAVAACDKADQYLVAWQSDHGTGGADYAIYARYLDGDAVPGNIHTIDNTTSPELNVDVDCNLAGDRYLLAWQTRYADPMKYGIWARIAWPDESLLPQFAVKVPGSATDREYPAVAGGRTGFLVAWEHQRDSSGNRDIHGRLLQYALHLPLVLRQIP